MSSHHNFWLAASDIVLAALALLFFYAAIDCVQNHQPFKGLRNVALMLLFFTLAVLI
jgi:hypothetical protein